MNNGLITVTGRFAAAAVAVGLTILSATDAQSEDEGVHLLFVQGAHEMQADTEAGILRLVGVADQTIYFSDRPTRVAGHLDTTTFVEHWGTGEDSFAVNPPNATLSVYDPGAETNHAVVFVVRDPALEGNDLTYHYEVLGGDMPASGGAAALFIDTFGPGGGVGAGFHGVGVGARGPGVAGWRGVAVTNECEATNNC